MIAMSTQDIEDILAFIIERFVVGTLTHENLTSFFNFLAKTSKLEINQANQACNIMRILFEEGFFDAHLKSFPVDKVIAFNA